MDERMKIHGAFSWVELMTTDVAGAKKFYGELLGWHLEDNPMEGTGQDYVVCKAGDHTAGGMMAMPAQAQGVPPHWGAYVTVDDVDAAATKAVELGGKVIVPPTDIPKVGRFSTLLDPQGAAFSVIQYVQD
ncbi:MAG: VOC family protein [Candidatus Eisenbacteria bacterium]|nr:VOC family protein [Candidatus Eisenbacteria bacterium]